MLMMACAADVILAEIDGKTPKADDEYYAAIFAATMAWLEAATISAAAKVFRPSAFTWRQ